MEPGAAAGGRTDARPAGPGRRGRMAELRPDPRSRVPGGDRSGPGHGAAAGRGPGGTGGVRPGRPRAGPATLGTRGRRPGGGQLGDLPGPGRHPAIPLATRLGGHPLSRTDRARVGRHRVRGDLHHRHCRPLGAGGGADPVSEDTAGRRDRTRGGGRRRLGWSAGLGAGHRRACAGSHDPRARGSRRDGGSPGQRGDEPLPGPYDLRPGARAAGGELHLPRHGAAQRQRRLDNS